MLLVPVMDHILLVKCNYSSLQVTRALKSILSLLIMLPWSKCQNVLRPVLGIHLNCPTIIYLYPTPKCRLFQVASTLLQILKLSSQPTWVLLKTNPWPRMCVIGGAEDLLWYLWGKGSTVFKIKLASYLENDHRWVVTLFRPSFNVGFTDKIISWCLTHFKHFLFLQTAVLFTAN